MSKSFRRICRHIARPDELPMDELTDKEQESLGIFIGFLFGFATSLILLQPLVRLVLSR